MPRLALVLDDIEDLRLTTSSYLNIAGFTTDCVENGIEGLKIINEKKYDLIVSDIEMPNMNGIEFLKRVKSDRDLKNIPFIVITSADNKEYFIKVKELGATCVIKKPCSQEKINIALKISGF